MGRAGNEALNNLGGQVLDGGSHLVGAIQECLPIPLRRRPLQGVWFSMVLIELELVMVSRVAK